MKEKINLFAKGKFEYQHAAVQIKPEKLILEVDAGGCLSGSFAVTNTGGELMKGLVCTDCYAMQIETEVFQGEENTIHYSFHAENLLPGENVSGKLQIISDRGSCELPFSVTVNLPSCQASTGKLRDLYQFAALAGENYREAVNLFQSPHFEEIFLQHNERYQEIYRGLVHQGQNQALALEEFLIAIHKKVPVHVNAEKVSFLYETGSAEGESEPFQDEIILHRDSWGMEEFRIETDGDFLSVEQKIIRTSQFAGNSYVLPFLVHPKKMRRGRNFGRILISGIHQSLEIVIEARRDFDIEVCRSRWQAQEQYLKMASLFLDFQSDMISLQEYMEKMERLVLLVDKNPSEENRWLSEVFRMQIAVLQHRDEVVSLGLERLEEQLDMFYESYPDIYCAYYYLKALWKKEEAVKEDCVRAIRECYVSRSASWKILWFLLCLDKTYDSVRKKLDDILEQLRRGCSSPVLYSEVCRVLTQAPGLLLDLDRETEQCLHWGCVHGVLGQELAMRYSFLAGRQKNYSRILLGDMRLLYQKYPDDDLLTVICKLQMSRRRVLEEDREWYAKGIDRNLKLTDLYEYYIYSTENLMEQKLPHRVLLYFMYNNHLNAGKRAALYAYIVQNYSRESETYQEYCKAIKAFTEQQLMEGRMNEELAVLYQEFVQEDTLTEELARKLPAVLFSCEITCYHSEIVGMIVHYRELEQEEFIPLVQGKAIVQVFAQTQLFLTDRQGNRYYDSVDYTLHKLLHMDYLAEKCLEYAGDDYRLLLHLYEKAEGMNQSGVQMMELRKRVLEISQLSRRYRRKVFASQLRACYDNFEGEMLDNMLEHMDWDEIEAADRETFLEYCAVRHCYSKAMEGIRRFGFGKLPAKRLLQVAGRAFASSEEESGLVKLAWYIFDKGQFDENLLRYLGKYYVGSVPKMVQVWNAADGFGIAMPDFQERILAQVLFTEEIEDSVFPVFYNYYKKGVNKKLIRAFLKYTAYCFLVHGRTIPEEMFGYFYREVRVEENRPCLLASLQYLSTKPALNDEETEFVQYHLSRLWEKQIVFPFYQKFYGKVSLPEPLMSRVYISYTANPQSQVSVRYRIVSETGQSDENSKDGEENIGSGREDGWRTESMDDMDMYEGIRVRGFVLFHGEVLEYSIRETDAEGRRESEVRNCRLELMNAQAGSAWHQLLDQMAMQMAGDSDGSREQLFQTMEEYAEKKEFVNLLIKPLREGT